MPKNKKIVKNRKKSHFVKICKIDHKHKIHNLKPITIFLQILCHNSSPNDVKIRFIFLLKNGQILHNLRCFYICGQNSWRDVQVNCLIQITRLFESKCSVAYTFHLQSDPLCTGSQCRSHSRSTTWSSRVTTWLKMRDSLLCARCSRLSDFSVTPCSELQQSIFVPMMLHAIELAASCVRQRWKWRRGPYENCKI